MRRLAFVSVLTMALAASPLAAAQHEESAPPAHSPAGGSHAASPEGAGHGEGAEHGGGHGHGPAPINWSDFGNKEQPPYAALAFNFVILLGLYVYFGRGPVAAALKKRRQELAREIEEAQRMRAEAEERAKLYQAKLARLEDELKEARQALLDAGRGEKERILKDAEERAARMQRDAEALVEAEFKQMRLDLTREAVETALSAAEEMLKLRITPSDQERLAEDYLADLAARNRRSMLPGPGTMAPPGMPGAAPASTPKLPGTPSGTTSGGAS